MSTPCLILIVLVSLLNFQKPSDDMCCHQLHSPHKFDVCYDVLWLHYCFCRICIANNILCALAMPYHVGWFYKHYQKHCAFICWVSTCVIGQQFQSSQTSCVTSVQLEICFSKNNYNFSTYPIFRCNLGFKNYLVILCSNHSIDFAPVNFTLSMLKISIWYKAYLHNQYFIVSFTENCFTPKRETSDSEINSANPFNNR